MPRQGLRCSICLNQHEGLLPNRIADLSPLDASCTAILALAGVFKGWKELQRVMNHPRYHGGTLIQTTEQEGCERVRRVHRILEGALGPQVLLRWALDQGVAVIPGTNSVPWMQEMQELQEMSVLGPVGGMTWFGKRQYG